MAESIAEQYANRRKAVERLRAGLNTLKTLEDTVLVYEMRVSGGISLEDLEIVVSDRESHYRGLDRMVVELATGGTESLGSAMSADFARLRGED